MAWVGLGGGFDAGVLDDAADDGAGAVWGEFSGFEDGEGVGVGGPEDAEVVVGAVVEDFEEVTFEGGVPGVLADVVEDEEVAGFGAVDGFEGLAFFGVGADAEDFGLGLEAGEGGPVDEVSMVEDGLFDEEGEDAGFAEAGVADDANPAGVFPPVEEAVVEGGVEGGVGDGGVDEGGVEGVNEVGLAFAVFGLLVVEVFGLAGLGIDGGGAWGAVRDGDEVGEAIVEFELVGIGWGSAGAKPRDMRDWRLGDWGGVHGVAGLGGGWGAAAEEEEGLLVGHGLVFGVGVGKGFAGFPVFWGLVPGVFVPEFFGVGDEVEFFGFGPGGDLVGVGADAGEEGGVGVTTKGSEGGGEGGLGEGAFGVDGAEVAGLDGGVDFVFDGEERRWWLFRFLSFPFHFLSFPFPSF